MRGGVVLRQSDDQATCIVTPVRCKEAGKGRDKAEAVRPVDAVDQT